ncbi:MAG: ABC transporter permease [Pseudomonadota bacterium]
MLASQAVASIIVTHHDDTSRSRESETLDPMQNDIHHPAMGQRRFGSVNWLGLWTLIVREVRRFLNVWSQTVLAPVMTSILFMVVFTVAFGSRRSEIQGLPFEQFLAPGILMMVVIQNAFANTSSSLMISKIQGNIVDTLMPPLSPGEILTGYVVGGVVRGSACALTVMIVIFPWAGVWPVNPLWMAWFALAGSVMMALLGLMAAIHAQRFDQMSAITNFVITPLSFLSGTFYSITALPDTFQAVSRANPFFYLIDGFRYGALGVSDSSPWVGFAITLAVCAVLWTVCWRWLATGYRLKP